MPLVGYDSDSDNAVSEPIRTLKRKSVDSQESGLPSLPDSFHDLYATAARNGVQDDPSLHGGRKRTIPHVDGIWPSHVYVEWRPDESSVQLMESALGSLDSPRTQVQSLLTSELGTDAPLHVSLSRTLSLGTNQRDRFFEHLARRVREEKIKSFSVQPDALEWFPNHEGNRWFLTLQLRRPKNDSLRMLLKMCNEVALEFGQNPLYDSDKEDEKSQHKRARMEITSPEKTSKEPFHISIAWSSKEPEPSLLSRTAGAWTAGLGEMVLHVDRIKVKLGNTIRSFELVD